MRSSKELLDEKIRLEVGNNRVFKAFKKVDRKLFVPKRWESYAYSDSAIPLDGESSISQPSLVAQMIDLLDLIGKERVLEIGTASGYSAAILSYCCKEVDTVEIDSSLASSAKERLMRLGFDNVTVHTGDGSLGLASRAPFDAIIVTAAAKEVPQALIDQLKNGGRIVIPLETQDSSSQELVFGLKKKDRLITEPVTIVRFVPLV